MIIEDRRKQTQNRRLDSWKEIATYFGRDERTVKRWEKDRGLPVKRLPGARGGVYTFTDDLAQWMATRSQAGAKTADPSEDVIAVVEQRIEPPSQDPPMVETSPADPPPTAFGVQERDVVGVRRGWLIALGLIVLGASTYLLFFLRREPAAAGAPPLTTVPASHYVPNPKAQDLFLQGRYYWNRRTPDDLKKALEYFQQAVKLDPNYALAYVGLADCYNLLREYAAMPQEEAFDQAIKAARRAVELDPSLADAHNSLAFDLFYGKLDRKDAEQEFQTALRLNPNGALVHHWFATYLMTLGRFDEALQHIETARQLDASSRAILADKGMILYYAGRAPEAISLLQQIEQAEPSFISPHRYLAAIYLIEGNHQQYLVEAKQAATLSKNQVELKIVEAAEKGLRSGGTNGMFEVMLREQRKAYAEGHLPAYSLAQTYAVTGNNQEALKYLLIARDQHEPALAAVLVDPEMKGLHEDPSYERLTQQLDLGPPVRSR